MLCRSIVDFETADGSRQRDLSYVSGWVHKRKGNIMLAGTSSEVSVVGMAGRVGTRDPVEGFVPVAKAHQSVQ